MLTRTVGAAGPLVLESGGYLFLFFYLYFTTPIFVPIWQFLNSTTIFTTNVYHIFYHKFYHKLLPQTTIIIGVSISTTTQIFVPIQQFFNFTTNFTTHFYHIFYHKFYHKLLHTNHYHNWGVNIYYHTNFCSNLNFFFNFTIHLLHMLPNILSQTTTTISTDPHNVFCTSYKCFERPAKIFIASN